ncbi:MAG: alpha/beta hydrolase [Gammaproteobacteria bacterium]|nr:alpha/beta hydrolase [Gammaproteobacteria bacterium]
MTPSDANEGKPLALHVDGRRLEAAWWGPPPGVAPTLVLLHEGLGCVALWRDFPARLAAATGCGVLAYSRLGYGGSDPCPLPRPLTYMHDEALEVLPRVLEAARIRDAVVVGHSDGGSIALVHAGGCDTPALRGVVTFAAHVFCEELSVKSIDAARRAYEEGDLRARLARYHGTNVDCAFWGWNRAWLDPEFMHWNLEEYLPGIDVPVLAIQGRDDEYGTAAQVEAIVAGCGAEPLFLDDCGHSPQRDREHATLEAVSRFVRRVLAGSADGARTG